MQAKKIRNKRSNNVWQTVKANALIPNSDASESQKYRIIMENEKKSLIPCHGW